MLNNNFDAVIYDLYDASDLPILRQEWNPSSGDRPRSFIKVNNEYYILMNSGVIWRRSGLDPSLNVENGQGDFIGPFGGETSSMSYAGNNTFYFARSTQGLRRIAQYTIAPGQAPLVVRAFDWPSEIPTIYNGGDKAVIATDYNNHLWITLYESTGAHNLYKVDLTGRIPGSFVLEESPNFLKADGNSFSVITAKLLDTNGAVMPNVPVTAEPDTSYLVGSSLINPITGFDAAIVSGTTDNFGSISFSYRAPTVTGTQGFIFKGTA